MKVCHSLLVYCVPLAGDDYSTTTLMVVFTPTDVAGQMVCRNVPIINDDLGNEGDELFSVTITNVNSSKVMIGPNQESCVTIIDDDSESNSYRYTSV